MRGGSSQSFLDSLPENRALFYGNLNTTTLGGAGFASQYSPIDAKNAEWSSPVTSDCYAGNSSTNSVGWDLTYYDGLEVCFGKADGKIYTLILKDEESVETEEGQATAGFNFEAEFPTHGEANEKGENEIGGRTWLPWADFKPTFRGREVDDGRKLNKSSITRVGIMMRSYFGAQEGDFKLELNSIAARKEATGQGPRHERRSPDGSGETPESWRMWLSRLYAMA